MIKKIETYVKKHHMLEQTDKVITGVSGGADSVCLLFVLLELQKTIGFELVAVHVNHQIRGEAADQDEQYVESLCATYKVPYEAYHRNVELIAKNRKQSMEEAGRNVRREAFCQTLEEKQGTKIALAHHKNDNAETLLLNLARGSGLKGLGGMAPVSGIYIRPLLCVERNEIELFLHQRGILYCTDESNKSDEYTRNRIRNHVIPFLEHKVNAKAVTHMSDAMERLREMQAYLDEQVDRYYEMCMEDGGQKRSRMPDPSMVVKKEKLEYVPKAIRPLVIQKILYTLSGQRKDVEGQHIEAVTQLLEKQVGRQIDLPYQMMAVRCYEGIRFQKCKNKMDTEERTAGLPLDLLAENPVEINGITIRWRICLANESEEKEQKSKKTTEKMYTKRFDYDIIKGTVKLRTRQPGDYLVIDEKGSRQKLKSYFINEKIPKEERDHILLLAEDSHILWVIGHRISSAYQVSKHTNEILEIQIDGGEKVWQRILEC